MQEADSLIRTKLHLPFARTEQVSRPRLQARIAEGLRGPLTLIIAPAGFGKTTLVASCVSGCGMPVAWLSLDKDDNQEGRFLIYLAAALQDADPRIGSEHPQLVMGINQAPSETVLTSLINDLEAVTSELVLVLDDYQFITSPAAHAEVAFILEHCPLTFHVLIASRSDPSLPLARLRARAQMVELRGADLRFTESEAAQFLNDVMRLRLDVGSIAVLEKRTEGWVAGLQMAAIALQSHLSMSDRKDIRGFVEGFSGTNRHILDYLMEEILVNQSPEIHQFLLSTSILERLTAPLCDAILKDDTKESSFLFHPSSVILESLERENLFLVSLDDKRIWFRYHHLFADLLRAQLHQLYPGLLPRLHALAASWYETNGLYEEAIHHALAAGDYPGAARLVEAVAENAWLNGQYTRILAWTKAIPIELVHSRPWLCIWNAWAQTQMGDSQTIEQWITTAEQSAIKQHEPVSSTVDVDDPQDALVLMNEIAELRVFAVSFSQDYFRAIELAETVLKKPPLQNTKVAQFTRCNLLHLLSSMYFATGNLLKAEQTCLETIDLAKQMGFTLRHLHCINKLILVNKVNGHLYRSYQKIEETQLFLEQQDFKNYFAAAQLRFRKAELFYEWNQWDEFQRLVEWILKQEVLVDVPYLKVDSCNVQALDLMNKQDFRGSQDALNKAKALAQQSYIWEGLTWRTEALQVRLWLKKRELSLAVAWASQPTAGMDDNLQFPAESRAIARARILLAQGANQETISLLTRLSDSAEVGGRKGSLIEIRALMALALLDLGEIGPAVRDVETALELAEPEGYIRTFLDEGQPMATLLSRIANNAANPHAKYAHRLLKAFQEEEGSARINIQLRAAHEERAAIVSGASNASLIEPLSGREVEVLQLMALGRTNQEIARKLIVAPGTIKAHSASIYRKLDVANRTEAVAHARQLGILS